MARPVTGRVRVPKTDGAGGWSALAAGEARPAREQIAEWQVLAEIERLENLR